MKVQALFGNPEEYIGVNGERLEGFSLDSGMVKRILSVAKPLGHNEVVNGLFKVSHFRS